MAATDLIATATGFQAQLDPGWDIWGPAGGYIGALALRAVREQAGDGHRPVTLTGQFVRRARPGAVAISVAPVKSGATALFLVEMRQGDALVFLAQIWTTARAQPCLPVVPEPPHVPGPEGLPRHTELMELHGITAIPFWGNLDGRPVNFRMHSDPPAASTHQYRWMRFTDWAATDDPFLNAMRYALLIDIGVWPGHWHRLDRPAKYGAPSLDLWVNFHDPAPAADWLLCDADSDVAGHGLVSGRVRLWSGDGVVLASGGGQCLVVPQPG